MSTQILALPAIDPEILTLAQAYDCEPESILEILRALQGKHGGLTKSMISDVARALRVPAERAFGVATFYSMLSIPPETKPIVRVCDGPPCWLRGAALARQNLQVADDAKYAVRRTSCLGLCDLAPAALIGQHQAGPLDPNQPVAGLDLVGTRPPTYTAPREGEIRSLLADTAEIDPDELSSARKFGAYTGLEKALHLSSEEVIEAIVQAGLRGRGGAGFPAGQKWRLVAQSDRSPRYVVCNADESEPLVFKDRVLIDANPHQLLEGIAIAGHAVGAAEGWIYIRGEYAPQTDRLARAIEQATEAGLLGDNILGSGFNFHIHLHRGAGAYICGEETALLESLEGRRGEPRARPPYPTVNGYRGQPTVVNNVETLAAVPAVLRNGADEYLRLGNAASPGTKLYTLLGHVRQPGLFEGPFGLTLRQIIDRFGGGMAPGSEFHFALTGGAAGTFVPSSLLDTPIDFNTPEISLGAGAILVCDQSVSPLALLRELMFFFEAESCGKCTPCRVGTHEARHLIDRMLAGHNLPGDLVELKRLADVLEQDSFCGLGIFAAMPVKSALGHFPESFGV